MKRAILSDIGAFFTGVSFGAWLAFGQGVALIITIVVGLYTIIEKHHNIMLKREERKALREQL